MQIHAILQISVDEGQSCVLEPFMDASSFMGSSLQKLAFSKEVPPVLKLMGWAKGQDAVIVRILKRCLPPGSESIVQGKIKVSLSCQGLIDSTLFLGGLQASLTPKFQPRSLICLHIWKVRTPGSWTSDSYANGTV